jgi:signal recognition particle subunit SRP54
MLDNLTNSFKGMINKIKFYDDEKALKKILTNLKKDLLKADVHFKVCKDLILEIEQETKKEGIGKENFIKAIEKSLSNLFEVSGNYGFVHSPKPPTVVLMMGLQGAGKTTTTMKLAYYLKQRNKKVLVSACDMQRLGAVEQLRQLSLENEIDVYIEEDNKSIKQIATNSLKKAKKELYDVLLIDTAGRLAIDDGLMNELEELKKAINPDEQFYVADAMSGQDGVRTANTFNEKIGVSGVILSKFDADTKGGVAISIAKQIGIPLRFIGTGEKVENLEVFLPERITKRLIGLGDVEGLAEKVSLIMDDKKINSITKKLKKGKFNFNDYLEQLESVKKIGNMSSILSMIPGASGLKEKLKNVDLENSPEIKSMKSAIYSMTNKEKEDPSLLKNISRKRRIAKGAGIEVADVNRALKQFKQASKMAKKMASGGMKGIEQMMASMGGNGGNNFRM